MIVRDLGFEIEMLGMIFTKMLGKDGTSRKLRKILRIKYLTVQYQRIISDLIHMMCRRSRLKFLYLCVHGGCFRIRRLFSYHDNLIILPKCNDFIKCTDDILSWNLCATGSYV